MAHGHASRIVVAASIVATFLCSAPVAAQAPNTRAMLPGLTSPVLLDTLGVATPISAGRDSIFAALSHVFAELEIPVEGFKRETGLVHNTNVIKIRELGKQPMSRYFDCGLGFSRPNADFYRIVIAISAWVEPAAGAPAKLLVATTAAGQDPAGSRSGWVACPSRGALEQRIAKRVTELLAAAK